MGDRAFAPPDVMQVGFLNHRRRVCTAMPRDGSDASPSLFSKLFLGGGTLRMLLFRLGVWEGWGDYFGRHG